MYQRRKFWLPFIALMTQIVMSCSGTRQIESTPKADVLVLNHSYQIEKNLGASPIAVESDENLARYRFERKKAPPEFLLVMFPDQLEGSLNIGLADGLANAEPSTYGPFFDQLLRAHRLMLRGDINGSDALISRIIDKYDIGYGTSVLNGTIDILRGNAISASEKFRYAKSLYPDAPISPALQEGKKP